MSLSERQISLEIQKFLKAVGGAVWSSEQGFRKERGGTRTSPGIPDLIVIFPHGPWTFAELKTEKGKLSAHQKTFMDTAIEAGIPWELWRDVRDAWDWCVRHGIITEGSTLS